MSTIPSYVDSPADGSKHSGGRLWHGSDPHKDLVTVLQSCAVIIVPYFVVSIQSSGALRPSSSWLVTVVWSSSLAGSLKVSIQAFESEGETRYPFPVTGRDFLLDRGSYEDESLKVPLSVSKCWISRYLQLYVERTSCYLIGFNSQLECLQKRLSTASSSASQLTPSRQLRKERARQK